MARQSLGDLLGKVEEPTPTKAPEPAPEAVAVPAPVAEPAVERTPAARPARAKTLPAPRAVEELPTYLRLVRKETRLREDQQNQLTLQARRLNRAKAAGTPRITDNTLIRVAVDLLLERIQTARGDDESAILTSIRRP